MDGPLCRKEEYLRPELAAISRKTATGSFAWTSLAAVFSTESGGHYKEHNIARWMEQLVEASKISWRATHVLRKTYGTRIADGGGGVAAIATHLRHKDMQTASPQLDEPSMLCQSAQKSIPG